MTSLHVRQIVNNLVANAQQHGAPPITVTIRCPTPAIAALTVSDHGPGFAPDLAPVAVQRFRRGDPARTQRGSGLGLAIVDAIVQRNSGELRICSNGVHHRSTDRYDVDCAHPAEGTHVTLLVPS
jgi:signal transduction histidine kinase